MSHYILDEEEFKEANLRYAVSEEDSCEEIPFLGYAQSYDLKENQKNEFVGFGKEGTPTRIDFVLEMNELLSDYFNLFDENDVANVSNHINNITVVLLDSSDDNLPVEYWAYEQYRNIKINYILNLKMVYENFKNNAEYDHCKSDAQESSPFVSEYEEMYWVLNSYAELLEKNEAEFE
jgi:hypothetical protein